jgi:hypothetical protein
MKIVIVGNIRTGTTVLNESLGFHSRLNLTHEAFHPHATKANVSWRLSCWPDEFFCANNIHDENNIHKYEKILDQILTMYDGFKIVYPHLKAESSLWDFIKSRCKIIHVLRYNKLDCAISAAIARSSGRWQRRKGEDWKDEPIQIDLDWLESHIRHSEELENSFRHLFADALEIQYDEFDQWDQMMFKILNFLGLEHEVLPPTLIKRTVGGLSGNVINWKEIITDSRFHKYLPGPKYFL